ncbi:MAG: FmdB family zinc ribbon protein [Gemmatimonadales bacterium]
MPTYEYRCPSGHVFERFFPRVSDKRRLPCPKCGKRAERQISGGVGVHFKGSGFYATDYQGGAATNKKETAETESKPAEKAPTKSKKDSSSDS